MLNFKLVFYEMSSDLDIYLNMEALYELYYFNV